MNLYTLENIIFFIKDAICVQWKSFIIGFFFLILILTAVRL